MKLFLKVLIYLNVNYYVFKLINQSMKNQNMKKWIIKIYYLINFNVLDLFPNLFIIHLEIIFYLNLICTINPFF